MRSISSHGCNLTSSTTIGTVVHPQSLSRATFTRSRFQVSGLACHSMLSGKSPGVVGFQEGPARAEVRGVSLTVLGWAIA